MLTLPPSPPADLDMKQIYKEEAFDVPEGVSVTIKARVITVVGPRGTLLKVRSLEIGRAHV